jgi:hypothetical protein
VQEKKSAMVAITCCGVLELRTLALKEFQEGAGLLHQHLLIATDFRSLDASESLLCCLASIFLVFASSITASATLATTWIDFLLEPGIIVGHHLPELSPTVSGATVNADATTSVDLY